MRLLGLPSPRVTLDPVTTGARLCLGLLAIGGGACRQEPPSYDARGPHGVGTAEATISGTDITVQVWYPSATPSGTVTYDGLQDGEATEDAPPDCAETRSLVAFSHGSGGARWQSAFFTEFLASWGYVVVAPDHPGNTFHDAFGDEDRPRLVLQRPRDVRDAVDWVLAAEEYAPCVDVEGGYAVAGHSFGGFTALALAGATVNDLYTGDTVDLADPRVSAAVAFAPSDASGALTDGTAAVAVPTLVLTGALDETTPLASVQSLWEPLTVTPRLLGVFSGAGHQSFAPMACVLLTGDGCGEGFIDLDTFAPLVNTSSTAFLEAVRGVPRALDALPLEAPEIAWTVVE